MYTTLSNIDWITGIFLLFSHHTKININTISISAEYYKCNICMCTFFNEINVRPYTQVNKRFQINKRLSSINQYMDVNWTILFFNPNNSACQWCDDDFNHHFHSFLLFSSTSLHCSPWENFSLHLLHSVDPNVYIMLLNESSLCVHLVLTTQVNIM